MIPGNDQHLGLVQFEYMLVDCTQRLGLAAGGHLNLTLTRAGCGAPSRSPADRASPACMRSCYTGERNVSDISCNCTMLTSLLAGPGFEHAPAIPAACTEHPGGG